MRQPRSGGTRLRVSWSRPTPSTSSPAGDSPARRGRLIAHDPDDASIFERSVGIGAEHTVLLPHGAHIVTGLIVRQLNHYPA